MSTTNTAAVGILMLETRFPRPAGDVGNPATWPFPVRYRTVAGASPERVVRRRAHGLLPAFIAAARDLVAEGAAGIVCNCGFLSIFQRELAAAVEVPVVASSLEQVPLVARLLPDGRRVGIVTVSATSLSQDHLAAAGVDPSTPIVGTEGGHELTRVILNDLERLDPDLAEADVLTAGEALSRAHPEVGAIVLECTNMGPYARALATATGRPVFDMTTLVTWFQAGLRPRSWRASGRASAPPG